MVDARVQMETIFRGDAPEVIPAVFRLGAWYNSQVAAGQLPAEVAGLTLPEVETHLGLANSARTGRVFEVRYRDPVKCVQSRRGDEVITDWHTPAGQLRLVRRFLDGAEAAGLMPTTSEYPIKTLDDYAAYQQIVEHTEYVPAYQDWLDYDRQIGPASLPMLILGTIPIHSLLIQWTGYEKGYFDLFDRPDVVLPVIEAANTVNRRMWDIVAESGAQLVMHGVNFDTAMTSPPVFREHFLPYLKAFNQRMHQAGKLVAFHADGNMSGLLDLVVEADYDVADCFACQPMVACTIEQARQVWADKITIWGALPGTLLEPDVPRDQLIEHLEHIYRVMAPGKRFVLGLADQALPSSSWEHIKLAAQWAGRHGSFPIGP